MSEQAIVQLTSSAAEFLITLQDMNRRLGALYQHMVPVLRRSVMDHSEKQCENIEVLIASAQKHLDLSKEQLEISEMIIPYLLESQLVKMRELVEVMKIWEEELGNAVRWMQNVLRRCSLTLERLVLEDE